MQGKEAELRQERERLLALVKAEAELSTRLQGEEQQARSLGSRVRKLQEQLQEKEAQSRQERERAQAHGETLLQAAREEAQRYLEECSERTQECAELKGELATEGVRLGASEAARAVTQKNIERMAEAHEKLQQKAESVSREMHDMDTQLAKVKVEFAAKSSAAEALEAEAKELRLAATASEGRALGYKTVLRDSEVRQQALVDEMSQLREESRAARDLAAQLARASTEAEAIKAELQEKTVQQRHRLVEMNDKNAKYVYMFCKDPVDNVSILLMRRVY